MRNRCLQLLTAVALTAAIHHPALAEPIEFTKFDKSHSTVGFHVPILGGMSQVEGKFMAFDVQLRYDASDPTKCMVGATIDASSINTGITDRDDHLRSEDFLNVAANPKIMFISKKVEKVGDALVVHGTLSMHGVSKPVDLAAEVKGLRTDSVSGDYLIGLHATTALNRQDFGITWKHADPLFVGDSIHVEINLISKLTPGPGSD
jgi:polyisoprenoid-binding protein YceI